MGLRFRKSVKLGVSASILANLASGTVTALKGLDTRKQLMERIASQPLSQAPVYPLWRRVPEKSEKVHQRSQLYRSQRKIIVFRWR